MKGNVLGIFAKEPRPGRVKTRLCPPLTPAQAARIYFVSLRETVDAMAGVPAELVLFHEGDPAFFRHHFPRLKCVPQAGGDLGRRMDSAFRHLFDEGFPYAALIGSDSPDLPPPLVVEAFSALRHHDLVVTPAADGGYVLIGERSHRTELFRDIPWSTAEVWPATRRRAERLGLRYRAIGAWDDLDDLAALVRLSRRSPDSMTARLAREILQGPNHYRESFPVMPVDLSTGDDR